MYVQMCPAELEVLLKLHTAADDKLAIVHAPPVLVASNLNFRRLNLYHYFPFMDTDRLNMDAGAVQSQPDAHHNDDFAQALLFAAQAGFDADVAPASGVCRAVWEDARLWERLVRLRPQRRNVMMSVGFAGNAARLRWLLDQGADIEMKGVVGTTALMCTAWNRHLAATRTLLAAGANVNEASTEERLTPLHEATRKNAVDVMEALLEYGADLNALAKDGWTPLHFACSGGHESAAIALINVGCALDCRTIKGNYTPLHFAAWKGLTDTIKALLKGGAQVNAVTSKEKCLVAPIHYACQYGHEAAVLALLEGGADLTIGDDDGRTPLHYAAEKGHAGITQSLLDRGAEIHALSRNRATPLHYAASEGHVDIVTALVARGASVNLKSGADKPFGFTPLAEACKSGRTAVALALVDAGTDINRTAGFSQTPIGHACEAGHDDTAIALIKRGADVNASDHAKRNILHFAAEGGRTAIALAALDHGAPIDARTSSADNSALRIATEKGHWECAVALLKRGANPNLPGHVSHRPLGDACRQGNVEVVHALIDHGAEIDGREFLGETPMQIACVEGHIEVVCALLDRGASCAALDRGKSPLQHALGSKRMSMDLIHLLLDRGSDLAYGYYGGAALHTACAFGRKEAVSLFLDRGADANAKASSGGETPLHVAITSRCSLDLITLLLDRGADLAVAHACGNSALHSACQTRCDDASTVKLLLERGADPNARNKNARTPLHFACAEGFTEAAKLLLEHGTVDVLAEDNRGMTPLKIVQGQSWGRSLLAMIEAKMPIAQCST